MFFNWNLFLLVFVGSTIVGLFCPVVAAVADNPDIGASFEKLVLRHGDQFDVQTHHVTTEDQFIITLYRIRKRSNETESSKRKPVILLHGLMHSAYTWIINSPNLYNNVNGTDNKTKTGDNLGYAIALTERYEAWIPNLRGNQPQHLTKDPAKDRDFWKFSFQHIALMDIPAVVDYVRRVTGRDSVGIVGTSLGTSTTFMLLAMRPEYSQRIRPFIATAPVLFVDHMTDQMFVTMAKFGKMFCMNDGELAVTGPVIQQMINMICITNVGPLCRVFIGNPHVNQSQIPVMSGHYPTSTSNRNGCHLSQWFNSKRFAQFDYGSSAENRKHYNQTEAPKIPLQSIAKEVQIALISSEKDTVATPKDVQQIRELLTDKIGAKLIKDIVIPASENWSHADFIFGMGAGKLVNQPVIDILDNMD